MYVCMHAPESVKMHSCLSPLHREVASRGRQKCYSYKASKGDPAQESSILTWGAAWLQCSEECGWENWLCIGSQRFTCLMWMCVFMIELGQPECHPRVVWEDIGRWKILGGLFMGTQNNLHKETHIITLCNTEGRLEAWYSVVYEPVHLKL